MSVLSPKESSADPVKPKPGGSDSPAREDAQSTSSREAASRQGALSPDGRQAAAIPVVVVTGMSGAGRSTALKYLEDIGYEAVDNMPLSLLASLVSPGELKRPLAIG